MGSKVQGSTFRVLSISLIAFIGNQVFYETSNSSAGPRGMIIYILIFTMGYVLLIQYDVKFTLYIGARSLSISKPEI